MKKTLLTIALAAGSFLMTTAQTSEVLVDFESIDNLNFWNPSGRYFNGSDTTYGVFAIDSVVYNGANYMTSKLKNSALGTNGSEWQAFPDNNYLYFSFDIKSESTINFGLKFEDSNKANLAEVYVDYDETMVGEWNTLHFDLSASSGLGEKELLFFIDIFNTDTYKEFSIDNITAYSTNPVGLMDVIKKEGVKLFPNPVADVLEISVDISNANRVTVYDNFGVVVLEQNVTSSSIAQKLDVSSLKNGAYRVLVASESEVVSNSFIVLK